MPVIPTPSRKSAKPPKSTPQPALFASSAGGGGHTPASASKKAGAGMMILTPRATNKVGDEEAVSPVGRPRERRSMSTDLSGASSSRSSQQLGRHAGAHSMSSTRVDSQAGGAGGASASQQQGHTPRQRKTLAPSSAQKAKNQTMSASAPPARRPTAKDYVASRVWKNESTLTFGMRVKLAEQPFLWADAQFAATNIVDIWTHYAGERDTLDRGAVTQLAADLVDRFVALYREQLLREQPGLAESDLQRAVKKDVWPHLLPGDNMVECKRIMAEKLTRELDVDHDGQITKTEFFFQVRREQPRSGHTAGVNDSLALLPCTPLIRSPLFSLLLVCSGRTQRSITWR